MNGMRRCGPTAAPAVRAEGITIISYVDVVLCGRQRRRPPAKPAYRATILLLPTCYTVTAVTGGPIPPPSLRGSRRSGRPSFPPKNRLYQFSIPDIIFVGIICYYRNSYGNTHRGRKIVHAAVRRLLPRSKRDKNVRHCSSPVLAYDG